MSAALQSDIQAPTRRRRRQITQLREDVSQPRPSLQIVTSSPADSSESIGSVQPLPPQSLRPIWLKLLMGVERGTSVITGILVVSTLVLYAWTVYSQRVWVKSYSSLTEVQKTQQQLTMANEALKNHLAQQAESPNSGLELLHPDQGIYVQPTELSPISKSPKMTINRLPGEFSVPIGY